MEDLLQKQIHESCKLALPDGLKDLMSDITREVLRAQPADLYKFITDYLSALLVTRDNLTVTSRLCSDVFTSCCHPELKDELRYMGLSDEEIEKIIEIVYEHFKNIPVKEDKLLVNLINKTDIVESQLPAILAAIRNAFLKHQANQAVRYESSSGSDTDEVTKAARHTIQLYRKTKPSEMNYHQMATKIEAAYRGYGVKRPPNLDRIKKHSGINHKSIHFDTQTEELFAGPSNISQCYNTASMTSLEDSCISKQDKENEVESRNMYLDGNAEKEHVLIDYTSDEHVNAVAHEENKTNSMTKKITSFHDEIYEELEVEADVETDELMIEEVSDPSIDFNDEDSMKFIVLSPKESHTLII